MSGAGEGPVQASAEGAVTTVWLNRPQKLNAVTPEMTLALREALNAADSDPGCGAIVLRGRGERAFCAGTDLSTLETYPRPWDLRNRVDYTDVVRGVRKPLVACLHGWVLGGGLEIAVNCDYRVAAASARFGMPEVGLGWVGAGALTQILPRRIGYGPTFRLVVGGERLGAEEALGLGLVDELHADEETAAAAAAELAARFAAQPRVAAQAAKAALRASWEMGVEAGARYEEELQAICFAEAAARDGVEGFLERGR